MIKTILAIPILVTTLLSANPVPHIVVKNTTPLSISKSEYVKPIWHGAVVRTSCTIVKDNLWDKFINNFRSK